MDEARSGSLHRWLSFCRLLMAEHPRVGAQQYADYFSGPRYQQGWNAIIPHPESKAPVQYVWIGEAGRGGRTTLSRPDVPDGQIHTIREESLLRLDESAAWEQTQKLAELVAGDSELSWGADSVDGVLESIRNAAERPLRADQDQELKDTMGAGLRHLKACVAKSRSSAKEIAAPVYAAARDYLDFRSTGTQASNIIAFLIATYAMMKSPLDTSSDAPETVLGDSADHLAELVSRAVRDRQSLSLGSFHTLTYWGLMIGKTAVVLLENTAQLLRDGDEAKRLRRQSLFVEETAVHELAPTLTHPMSLCPFGPSEGTYSGTLGIIFADGMYPGAAGQGAGPVDFAARWSEIESHSAGCPELDLVSEIEDSQSPVSPQTLQRLTMHLIAMQMGSGR